MRRSCVGLFVFSFFLADTLIVESNVALIFEIDLVWAKILHVGLNAGNAGWVVLTRIRWGLKLLDPYKIWVGYGLDFNV